MSRSSLDRGANRMQQRKLANESVVLAAHEEGGGRKGDIAIHGSTTTFNLNSLLHKNIVQSPYFVKLCEKVTDWKALVDEIYNKVDHMEPFSSGHVGVPSTAFCLLYRLLTMRSTEKQMHSMLEHLDSPYIRCIGFLYLRFSSDPAKLMDWFKPYVYDTEEFAASAAKGARTITIGEYVRSLITDLDYYGTMLPRIPVPTQRTFKVKLLQEEQNQSRAKRNEKKKNLLFAGAACRALYEDEENPLTWYDAIIDSVEPTVNEWDVQKYSLTFPEYGNQEVVSIGEIEPDGGPEFMADMSEIMRRERDNSASSGKGERHNIKGVMASMATGAVGNKRSRDVSDGGDTTYVAAPPSSVPSLDKPTSQNQFPPKSAPVRSKGEIAAAEEKKRRLAQNYA